ncbi:MAG: UMF1 family MFS transporter [Flavobacteriales bacterium]|jgi:UMF1 family MFS transporter
MNPSTFEIQMSDLNNKKTQKAWAFYDWANSVYPLVITTAIFPIFYNAVTTTKVNGIIVSDRVMWFGREFANTEIYSYIIAASLIVVSLLSPMLSGIADYSGKKKFFMKIFCYLGSISCVTLFFFDSDRLELSFLALFFASIGYWNSIVFYNAFLPEVAAPKDQDRLSARGYSLGYIGSVLLLIIILAFVMGVSDAFTRYSFILVGIWWLGFAQITFRRLPENPHNRKPEGKIWKKGFQELKQVQKQISAMKGLRRYLFAFFVFSMAVQTIMTMAQFFGMKEVFSWTESYVGGMGLYPVLMVKETGLSTAQLIIAIILVQIIAIPGAVVFSRGSKRFGNITMLAIALISWIGVCLFAFIVVDTPTEFYFAAGWIGFMMGGTQSLSRSTYSKMLPETKDTASFFSYYDVLEKIGMVIGMLSFGMIEGLTGSMRNSVLSLIIFFVIGLILLLMVPRKGAIQGQST